MRDHGNWSVSLGQIGGVYIRVHILLLMLALSTLYLAAQGADPNDPAEIYWIGWLSLGVLFISVAIHELGHCFATHRLGGQVTEVVLGPWGGMQPSDVPGGPPSRLIVALSGPLANLTVCFVTGLLLLVLPGHVSFSELFTLLSPIAPADLTGVENGIWMGALKLTFWVNWLLILINLLPAFPLDGGYALKAGLLVWRPELDDGQASRAVCYTARFVAIGLAVAAFLVSDAPTSGGLMPPWYALAVLSVFLLFGSQQRGTGLGESEPSEESEYAFGYDFSEGYTSLERSSESQQPKQKQQPEKDDEEAINWFEARQTARHQRQQEADAAEDQSVDEILTRLHEQGMGSLSVEDRELLQRASARYRSRG